MIIGITGGLATGTSTAAKYLRSYLKGYLVDADKIAHLLLKKKNPAYKKIVSNFGRSILKREGAIDRGKLAKKAFDSKKNLKKLCSIVHPAVIARVTDAIKDIYKKKPSAFIIVDGPVLIESGFYKRCDTLTVVTSSLMLQLERIQNYKRISVEDGLIRISFQLPLHKKVRYADYIIDNSNGIADLRRKCKRVAEEIRRRR